ncbi:MAG: hypothetical protein A2W35_06570 [Chloroflexi bacterium RBG_16_57_11]|nr:MAG: hypothetical protein A2W35_06570 [Chloroflexi bacterium RBG_16_57_11]HKZ02390.1 hypothetical protein [Pyrinomonadaceae bacterium]
MIENLERQLGLEAILPDRCSVDIRGDDTVHILLYGIPLEQASAVLRAVKAELEGRYDRETWTITWLDQ